MKGKKKVVDFVSPKDQCLVREQTAGTRNHIQSIKKLSIRLDLLDNPKQRGKSVYWSKY